MAKSDADRPAMGRFSSKQPRMEKDAEELALEEQLFGTTNSTSKKRKFPPGRDVRSRKQVVAESSDGEQDDGASVDAEYAGMHDDQLFMVDAPIAGGAGRADAGYETSGASDDADDSDDDGEDADTDEEAGEGEGEEDSEGSELESGPEAATSGGAQRSTRHSGAHSDADSDVDNSNASDSNSDENDDPSSDAEVEITLPADQYDLTALPAPAQPQKMPKGIKRPVWADPSDELIGLDLDQIRRLRKLGRGKRDSKVGGAELERRLREQFERLHPPPEWAKRRYIPGVPSLSSLFASTSSFIASPHAAPGRSRAPLPQGAVELQRLRNANQANPTAGKRSAANAGNGVVDFVWHPSPRVPVGVVAGGDRRVRFFNIDGHTNPTLLTLHIPSLPLTKTTFHPSGSTLLITGTRPFYYTYDLVSQKCLRSPRDLFGSLPSPSAPQSLTKHAFSPDGSLLAVAGRRGAVSILDWSSTGAGAVVAELRTGRGGRTAGMVWSADGRELEVLGGRDGAEVEVWDIGERRVRGRWADDRAYGGNSMRRSKDGEYTAVGSSTGIVNMYRTSSLSIPSSRSQSADSVPTLRPEPVKSLEHLTTGISSMDFHPSGEMFVSASTDKKDALRMYHLPSATAFSNWPTPQTPLGRITATAFSSSGEYLAVGNTRGHVLLWSLKHFAQ